MKPYYEDSYVQIFHGDCREILPELDPVETCITDPPYGLAFMGKEWDHAVPDETYWTLVRETVLPGGMLLAFGGTRLWHWLAVGIEEAGWEIRDTLMWLYGQGFPKSLDISKAMDKEAGAEREDIGPNPSAVGRTRNKTGGAYGRDHVSDRAAVDRITAPATDAAKTWDGWGTALKPAWEPIVLAMNPTDGTFAENARKYGVAGLNIDGARLDMGEEYDPERVQRQQADSGGQIGRKGAFESWKGREVPMYKPGGRWPANVVLDEDAAERLDGQSGERPSGGTGTDGQGARTGLRGNELGRPIHAPRTPDSGGASRFFYTAKASRADRGPGNDHPTVKPSDLMKWLCTLTKTPEGGTVLDPFMGSGTTLYAAKETGRKAVGIELEEKWCEVAAERLSQGVLDLGGAA